MIIKHTDLRPDTLNSIIREYALREGTDYGEIEISLDCKCDQLLSKIVSGECVITYSEAHETINIMERSEITKNTTQQYGH